ncbi:sodium/proton antiporter NhaB [Amphritea pacifica]|uniref:Na(+)/H(+) antiporter NhaB n=1 Tax=Amphritea pacifica TaxID=2811233 RepID=A0ABS2W5Y5_9GAMM|nr:sodium/proton antiporter NhaB [Amphritea pacifica]MBN0987121.1 sodium/proton antiporter NhaB [Amphritea pacifica]MBN1007873.1 sodium/proton antiporter NhaB [Amphritea pacifica]
MTTTQALIKNFLGNSPIWYKQAIVLFLILNPILLFTAGPVVTGWMLIFEFIFTLALALKCYPLQPGGLLALEAIIIGLASTETVYHEVEANLEVILLLMFMVAGIYFMKNMLLWVFTKLLLKIRSKVALSLMFSLFAALLSAFLDALTVTAVLISVGVGFYAVYHKVASGKQFHHEAHDHGDDETVHVDHHEALAQFRAFLRSLLMHGSVGTALGGVCTLVGEPQNLLIAQKAGWDFVEFFVLMAPVTMPVLFAGLATCILLEKLKWFGYGADIPQSVRTILEDFAAEQDKKLTKSDKLALFVQILVAVFLVLALAFHLAAVGLIGLTVIILLTAFNGIVEEHQIGKAFEEALPFTALLVVFFSIVSVIHEQHLFQPIIASVLAMDTQVQPGIFFIANGLLSAISDNVFVATVYINEVLAALKEGSITREHFDLLAIAINTGTNIPSVATPNGQAAFLFLLTSALAPLIRLSYGTMVWMALPYTVVMSVTGYLAVTHFL